MNWSRDLLVLNINFKIVNSRINALKKGGAYLRKGA